MQPATKYFLKYGTVVVAQLVKWLLNTLDICGSNPAFEHEKGETGPGMNHSRKINANHVNCGTKMKSNAFYKQYYNYKWILFLFI